MSLIPTFSPSRYEATKPIAASAFRSYKCCDPAVNRSVPSRGLLFNPRATYHDIIENEKILSFPAMMLAYAGTAEGVEATMTGRDDIVYQFRLRIVDRCHPDDNANQDRYELWKQQVMRAIRNQRAAGVVESVITRVQPQASQFLVNPPAWAVYTQNLLIECVCREPRG